MKKKVIKTLLSLTTAAALVMASPAALWASEAKTEAAEKTAPETDKDLEKTAEDFQIDMEGEKVTVKNQTTRTISKTEYKQDSAADASSDTWELLVTEESGDTHTFGNITSGKWKDPVFFDEYGFLYIKYDDAQGKNCEIAGQAEEKKFDKPLTMYASSNVHIRKEAKPDAESQKVLSMGEECKVSAAVPGWFKVESGKLTGYVSHSYLTENKEAVEAALKAQKEAEAAQAAAAAQAQAAADAQEAANAAYAQEQEEQQQEQQEQQPQEVYEVSREAFDDCDGSGHGYYEVTYSDGSVAYEEY